MTLQAYFVLGSWVVFVVYWGISALNVKRDIQGSGIWYWGRNTLVLRAVAIVAIFLIIYFRGNFFNQFGIASHLSAPAYGSLLASIGTAFVMCGIAYAVWARVHLGRNWSSHPSLKEGHELVTSGPYKLVRHPIYTGVLLAMFGSALASNLWWLIPFLVFCFIFVKRVFKEEKIMTKEFPAQYPIYKKDTWVLIPYVW